MPVYNGATVTDYDVYHPMPALKGIGAPNGVVTAPAGATYMDVAGTLGAWEWIKKTGSGNTGWVVSNGDTGSRNITALLTASAIMSKSGTDNFSIRRVGQQVELLLPGYNMTTLTMSTGTQVMSGWPAGFSPPMGPHYYPAITVNGGYSGFVNVHDTGLFIGAVANNQGDRACVTWYTPDAWPTTLPGV